MKISGAQYDSPGSDGGSNLSLNAEWVRITNTGRRARTPTGWTLRDHAHHVYRFGTFRLGAGKSVLIHTGSGRNTTTHRYWGCGWYIWNNDGDRAVLTNKRGTTVSTPLLVMLGPAFDSADARPVPFPTPGHF